MGFKSLEERLKKLTSLYDQALITEKSMNRKKGNPGRFIIEDMHERVSYMS